MSDSSASFTSKDKVDDLFKGLKNEEFDYIIIPYNIYLNEILENDYNIVYNFKDLYENYVLTLSNNNDTVNSIMKKYVELWKENKLTKLYSEKFNSLYFDVKKVSTKNQADFKGKIYTYGYVENLPYENVVNDGITGINGEYINSFMNLADIEIKFKKYDSIESLTNAFRNKEIDIMFNNFISTNNNISGAEQTISVYDNDYVVLTNINSSKVVDSIKSLKNEEVYILKDSLLADYVNKNVSAKVKVYKNH